jgi:plastocyanin
VLLCLAAGPVRAAHVPVSIAGFKFVPASVTVNQGDSVTWTQKDTTQHTSTSDTGLWNSPFLNLNQTFSQTFNTAGTFPYHCIPHASFMKASVTVKAVTANQPPAVSITSPTNNASLTDMNVKMEATASDPDGSIASVEFFDGDKSLAVVTGTPYQTTATLTAGAHSLTAKATDNAGASTVSSAIHVQVIAAATAPTLSDAVRTADGKFQFTLHGTAGQTYQVQASADLKTWNMIQTVKPDSDHMTVTDTPAAGAASTYYRAQAQ